MCKIFHSNDKLIVNDSVIDKAFGSMHQNVMSKIKNSVTENCIFKRVVENQNNDGT